MVITCRSFLLLLLISLFVSFVSAGIRFTEIGSDDRHIIPLDEFEFTHTGRLELNVSHVTLSNKNPFLNLAKLGRTRRRMETRASTTRRRGNHVRSRIRSRRVRRRLQVSQREIELRQHRVSSKLCRPVHTSLG
ncbi:hypothetical protein V6N13_086286 [Hibiscus sabdariffa]|uniref:CAND6/7 N-terminal domain-containing protein n=1 Tax=Hibiscus sabdariffa TaxID=183260 RepID=A0ABR2FT08_9ROSI